MLTAHRFLIGLGICLVVLLNMTGCGALAAGIVVALVSTAEDEGGSEDRPPAASIIGIPAYFGVPPNQTPDVMVIAYRVRNDDAGFLAATIEIVTLRVDERFKLVLGGEGQPIVEAGPFPAEPAPGSPAPTALPNDVVVAFHWDVKRTLGEDSVWVQAIVTPLEDGAAGPAEWSVPFRAGNEPIHVENLEVAPSPSLLTVTFDLIDRESDVVRGTEDFMKIALAVAGAGPPLELAPRDVGLDGFAFASAPQRGAQAYFIVDTERFQVPGMSERGSLGELTVSLWLRDFTTEEFPPEPFTTTAPFDFNEPPRVEILPLPSEALADGIIPLRYRVIDSEMNAGDITVTVGDAAAGAFELPLPPSEGTSGRCALSPLGDPAGCEGQRPSHTFLWDAYAQTGGWERTLERMLVTIRASDREEGIGSALTVPRLSPPCLRLAGHLPTGDGPTQLAKADFNGDDRTDLVVLNKASSLGHVTCFTGGPEGLTYRGTIEPGGLSHSLTTGDFNGDGYADLVLANRYLSRVTYALGCANGLLPHAAVPVLEGEEPFRVVVGAFNADAYDDVVVLVGATEANHLAFLRGSGQAEMPLLPWKTLSAGGTPGEAAVADTNGDGVADIVITVPESHEVIYVRGAQAADGAPEIRGRFPVGTQPRALVTGFFDRGPYEDVAIMSVGSGTVTCLYGTAEGLGRREANPDIPVGLEPVAMTPGDFDGDELLDLAVAKKGSSSNSVTCLYGTAGGLERREANPDIPVGLEPAAMAVGDFDGDAFTDLAVANVGSDTVTCLYGAPAGLARREGADDLGVAPDPAGMTAAHLDGDGFLDLMVASRSSQDATLLRGTRRGLVRAGEFTAGKGLKTLMAGDFERDGLPDVVVANADSNTITYLRGARSGLAPLETLPAGDGPTHAAVGDFDDDGFSDMVVANKLENTVTCLRGSPEGLRHERAIAAGTWPVHVATGDFDGDGLLDAVVAGNRSDTITYLRGPLDGDPIVVPLDPDVRPRHLIPGDFTCDGIADVLVVNEWTASVAFLRGGRDRRLAAESSPIQCGGPDGLAVGDVDGDGCQDAVAAHAGKLRWHRGGAAGFAPGAELLDCDAAAAVKIVGLNDDEFADVVAMNSDSRTIVCLLGSPAGPQPRGGAAGTGPFPAELAAGDFDGDGILDLAVINAGSTGAVTCVRFTPGGPIGGSPVPVGNNPVQAVPGDFDGDGFLDLAVLNERSNDVSLLRGTPGGLVRRGAPVPVGLDPIDALAGDFDGDGFLDLVVANKESDSVTVLRGTAQGLAPGAEHAAGDDPILLRTGDFDGDGFLDLAALNQTSDDVTSFRQRFFRPHVRAVVTAPATVYGPCNPPQYRLELPAESTRDPIDLCILPGPCGELQQDCALGNYVTVATDTIRLLPETLELDGTARLTLRVRDPLSRLLDLIPQAALAPRVFCWSPAERRWRRCAIDPSRIELVPFDGGTGFSLPISRFGAYLVALEFAR